MLPGVAKIQDEFVLNTARIVLKGRGAVSNVSDGALVKIVEICVGEMPEELQFDPWLVVQRVWSQIRELSNFAEGEGSKDWRQ